MVGSIQTKLAVVKPHTSILERAFELARSGQYASVVEVRRALRAEGYSDQLLVGPVLLRQLRDLIAAGRPDFPCPLTVTLVLVNADNN